MDELLKLALVGTSQQPSAVAGGDHPIDALLADLPAGDREHALLMRAGARAVFDQCGWTARTDVAAVEPAPADTSRLGSAKLVEPLRQALGSNDSEMLLEFLHQMEAAGIALPHELLPDSLNLRDAAVREAVLPVLGERGRWLSRFQPEWGWVTAGVSETGICDRDALRRVWDEGTIRDRCRALATLRRSDPAEARQWLALVYANERAEHRSALLLALGTGLSAADEALLEEKLDDRSAFVRQTAAGLLAQIAGSALAARMQSRADAMITSCEKGLFCKKLKLACSPPEEVVQEWERDGISPKPPAGQGKRAFWAERVLAAVPPSHWSCKYQADPPVLIAAILDDTFADDVLAGWTRAAATFASTDEGSAGWLRPLAEHWINAQDRQKGAERKRAIEHVESLLAVMPTADAEAVVGQLLETTARSDDLEALGLLQHLRRPWSVGFSRAYLARAADVLKRSDARAYNWAATLSTAAAALEPLTFDAALALCATTEPQPGSWHSQAASREVERFAAVVSARRSFYAEIASQGDLHRV